MPTPRSGLGVSDMERLAIPFYERSPKQQHTTRASQAELSIIILQTTHIVIDAVLLALMAAVVSDFERSQLPAMFSTCRIRFSRPCTCTGCCHSC